MKICPKSDWVPPPEDVALLISRSTQVNMEIYIKVLFYLTT